MNWPCNLAACLFALALVAAALIYPFRSKFASDLVKRAGLLALAILIVPPVLGQVARQADALTLVFVFVPVSVVAYLIREARKPRQAQVARQRRAGGGERKPVLPRLGGES